MIGWNRPIKSINGLRLINRTFINFERVAIITIQIALSQLGGCLPRMTLLPKSAKLLQYQRPPARSLKYNAHQRHQASAADEAKDGSDQTRCVYHALNFFVIQSLFTPKTLRNASSKIFSMSCSVMCSFLWFLIW